MRRPDPIRPSFPSTADDPPTMFKHPAVPASLAIIAFATNSILFRAVQLTMFGAAWRAGERFNASTIAGVGLTMGGLISLLGSGTTAVDTGGAVLMAASGAAWGIYSRIGQHSRAPRSSATGSFLLAAPVCLVFCAPAISQGLHWNANGLLPAALGGLLFLGEPATLRVLIAGITTLAGVWLMLQHTLPGRLVFPTEITGDRR